MKYRFILTYQATDSETTATRTCFPLRNDDLAVNIDREEGEWYYTRNLDGKLVFTGDDYNWIMGQEFDGTFTLIIKESHDNGATYYDYFTGTFSRASLEIDEDNHTATLNGLKDGIADLIKNGAKEDYDLMKLIPNSEAKTVQGQVYPVLAIIDYNHEYISHSDMYCNHETFVGPGYKSGSSGFSNYTVVTDTILAHLTQIYAEAEVVMRDHSSPWGGIYSSPNDYIIYERHYSPDGNSSVLAPVGSLRNNNYGWLGFSFGLSPTVIGSHNTIYITLSIYDNNGVLVDSTVMEVGENETNMYSPSSLVFSSSDPSFPIEKITIYFHYIRLSTLYGYYDSSVMGSNFLDTADYYKGVMAYNGAGLSFQMSRHTVETPNGHRLIPGTGEGGTIPQYFAPPDKTNDWIPLAEDNWNYASMWYTINPPVTYGLFDPNMIKSFQWSLCWNIGTCIRHLLNRITNGQVVFAETTNYSQFLYGNPNPVENHEPFQWLVTQKSNVMRGTAESAARCIVRLEWFFELLRNAFNCYCWFEKRNDGKYDFKIEHVEYFRRGGTYTPNTQDDPPLDLTRLKPVRNFLRNGQPAKRYADQTNKYSFDLDGMVEKYTYSWQGDGGGDDFKGNPMYFRAGWIEKGSSEDHQVDNIFADLGWLMLNAGTATESSKNYDGLFIFGGYNPYGATTWMYPSASGSWKENSEAQGQYLVLATATSFKIACDIWLTVPAGETVIVKYERVENPISIPVQSLVGTGHPQQISINERRSFDTDYRLMVQFPNNYSDVTIHRIHTISGDVYRIPNVDNKLRENTYLQNGVLAWPWLQCEYLHYDIPAAKWTYLKDEYTDNPDLVWESDGTIKMAKKQTLAVVPVPDASTEDAIRGIMGVKTGLGTGIIDNAKINLSSRNAEMTIIYDINPDNN